MGGFTTTNNGWRCPTKAAYWVGLPPDKKINKNLTREEMLFLVKKRDWLQFKADKATSVGS